MKFHAPGRCPLCGGNVRVEALKCERCGTRFEGRFELIPFHRLNREDLEFLTLFLQHWGNLSKVARDFGVSYPTVRSRYREILEKLGLVSVEEADPSKVLSALERGEISVDEALKLLKGENP